MMIDIWQILRRNDRKRRHRRIKNQCRYEHLVATSELSLCVPHNIYLLIELILGHMCYLLTNEPSQPSYMRER